MTVLTSHATRWAGVILLLGQSLSVVAQVTRPADELGLAGVPPETPVLILPSDPTAEPVEPLAETVEMPGVDHTLLRSERPVVRPRLLEALGGVPRDGNRIGCADVG